MLWQELEKSKQEEQELKKIIRSLKNEEKTLNQSKLINQLQTLVFLEQQGKIQQQLKYEKYSQTQQQIRNDYEHNIDYLNH